MGQKRTPGLIQRGGVWHIEKQVRGRRIRESCGTSNLREAETYLSHRLEELRQAEVYGVRPNRSFKHAATHMVVMLAGLAVIFTGALMMFRVRTPFLPRDPYLFGDMTWGWMYVLHGLAGIGFIGLVMGHIYFAIRPEKLELTKSMIFGSVSREHYLEHHDPDRWQVAEKSSSPTGAAGD